MADVNDVFDQFIADRCALFNGDCIQGMQKLPSGSVHFTVYSPPFGGLYHYSSNDRDLSNCSDYDEFLKHYEFVVAEKARITMPGRMTAVHCMDVPRSNSVPTAISTSPATSSDCTKSTGGSTPVGT